jgi:diguanylate cyclase (GGDEF)-like protein
MEFSALSIVFLASSLLVLGLAIAARQRRNCIGSGIFSLLMMAVAVWLIGRAFEGAAPDVTQKIFWAKIEYLGIPWIGIFWIIFILKLVHKDKILTPRIILLAGLIPAITTVLAFTNEAHHLIWSSIQPDPSNSNLLIYFHGPWFWLSTAYSYLAILSGMVLMLVNLPSAPSFIRRQSFVLIIGVIAPLTGNLIYLAGLSPIHGLDLTPFGFILSGMIFAWVVFGLNLFRLVPMAHEHLVDSLLEGILVLDPNNLVADINPSAMKLLKIYQSPIGMKIDDLTHLSARFCELPEGNIQLQTSEEPPRHIDLQIIPLVQNKLVIGRLVVIQDITGQKRAEGEQTKARKRAEALNEITHSIYHKLEYNELMELIYQQINRFMDARFFLIASYDPESDEWESNFLKEPGNEFPKARYKSSEGITGYVIQNREPLLLNNTPAIDLFLERTGRQNVALKPKSLMIVPLISAEGVVGAMGTQNYEKEDYYSEDDFYFFTTVGLQIAAALTNAASFAQMEQLAITDPLTGLYNRRYLFSLAQVEFDQSARYQHAMSAIMLDIDHFKSINDLLGHSVGDQVLQSIAEICRKSFRKVDTVGRYGGEEFLIILPETNASQALIAAERLRSRISQADIEAQEAHIQVTVSMGVASLDTADSLECLVEQADKAMYSAKQAGRNQTKVYPGE